MISDWCIGKNRQSAAIFFSVIAQQLVSWEVHGEWRVTTLTNYSPLHSENLDDFFLLYIHFFSEIIFYNIIQNFRQTLFFTNCQCFPLFKSSFIQRCSNVSIYTHYSFHNCIESVTCLTIPFSRWRWNFFFKTLKRIKKSQCSTKGHTSRSKIFQVDRKTNLFLCLSRCQLGFIPSLMIPSPVTKKKKQHKNKQTNTDLYWVWHCYEIWCIQKRS